jgi:hypothetical protein
VGPQGNQGIQGLDGAQGRTGRQGSQGTQGLQGTQGNSGGGLYTYSAVAPSSPSVGDRWYHLTKGTEYTYSFDGNSYQWIGNGNIAVQGTRGLQGNQGSQGVQGIQGKQAIVSYSTVADFPATGSDLYFVSNDSGRIYQWTGSVYSEIGPKTMGINNAEAAINLYMWSNFK